jgi:hypothetical protein
MGLKKKALYILAKNGGIMSVTEFRKYVNPAIIHRLREGGDIIKVRRISTPVSVRYEILPPGDKSYKNCFYKFRNDELYQKSRKYFKLSLS